jgi:hypothetical protein
LGLLRSCRVGFGVLTERAVRRIYGPLPKIEGLPLGGIFGSCQTRQKPVSGILVDNQKGERK